MLIDLSRKKKVRENTLALDPDMPDEFTCFAPTPELESIDKQQVNILISAINELPEEQQDLLVLSRLQGMSIKDIAQKKQRSLSWVEKAMAHALLYCKNKTERHDV